MNAVRYCPRCGGLNTPEATRCFACEQSLSPSTNAVGSTLEVQALLRQRYRLLRQLGTGGFGAVYKAEDTQLGNRLVAIKSMRPRGLSPAELQEATEAFHREALLLARLAHPHLPRIYEQFEENGQLYLVMDFIEGQTLEDYLAQCGGSLPVKEAIQLGLQLTDVLAYLHTRQPPIIFRDLKPSNVLRAPDGQIYLIDFGIARLFKPGQAKDTIAFGSPGYAAPEQYGKTQTTPRSDVYSLGALLHHLLTGTDPSDKPFRFTSLTMRRPMGLSTLLERMVAMDAEQRPVSMEIVRRDLERLLSVQAPWHGDDPGLTGMLPRVTRAFPSYQPSGAPLAYPPAPPAWPQQNTFQPPQGRAIPASKKRLGRWLLALVLFIFVGIPAISSIIRNNTSGVVTYPSTNVTYGDTPDTSGLPTATDAPTGSPTATDAPSVPPIPVYVLAWSPDGKEMASGGADSMLQIWNPANAQKMASEVTDFNDINALAWSPDSKYIASAGDKGKVQIWKADGTFVTSYPVISSGSINALAWSPKSQRLAVACTDHTVQVVDALTGDNSFTYTGHSDAVNAVAWSPDGGYIASGGNDGTVQVWDSTNGKPAYLYASTHGPIDGVAWSPNGKRIASTGSDNTVQIWDALTGKNFFLLTDSVNNGYSNGIQTVAWAPDSAHLASGGNDPSVIIWEDGNPSSLFTYNKQTGNIHAVVWSSDGTRVASASDDGTVQIWDALTGGNVVTYHQQP